MKKMAAVCLILALVTAIFLAGCGGNNAGERDTLSGSTEELLTAIVVGANKLLPEDDQLAESFTDVITAENSEWVLGVSSDDFARYVTDAYSSTASIITFAHQVALMKCKDFSSAAQMKRLVASGFDSDKWICVWPERSFVVESGSYVLLVASTNTGGDKILESFKTLANNNVGEVNIFYKVPL